MARFPGLVGPFAKDSIRSFNQEDTINLYLRGGDAGSPKSQGELVVRPGLDAFCGLGAGPVRALFQQDGRVFGIGGGQFCEIHANGLIATWGTVQVDSHPATISSNGSAGNQLFITSGGLGYIFALDTNDLTQITDDAFPNPVTSGAYLDGYFVALKGLSRQFYLSALLDGESWDGLDVGEVSTTSENLVQMAVSHRELWLFGTKTTQVWYDSGNSSFPMEPVGGVFIQQGIAAPWSIAALDNTIFWLGKDERGQGVVWRANGYTPQRVSTHAVEQYLQDLGRMDDAIGWTFQLYGSLFYALYLPQADTTLLYDVASGSWVRWAIWNEDQIRWEPHLGRCHCYAFGKHLVGDRQSGVVYEMTPERFEDRIAVGA